MVRRHQQEIVFAWFALGVVAAVLDKYVFDKTGLAVILAVWLGVPVLAVVAAVFVGADED